MTNEELAKIGEEVRRELGAVVALWQQRGVPSGLVAGMLLGLGARIARAAGQDLMGVLRAVRENWEDKGPN